MLLPKVLLFTLTFSKLFICLDAVRCPKGHRVTHKDECIPCADGYYQAEENESHDCRPCTKCSKEWGSFVKEECTKEKDRICQCQAGFVPLEKDASTCKCGKGFEPISRECSECKDGHFSTGISRCKEWKKCKSGVKNNGTKTSDVVCNDEKSDRDITTKTTTTLRPRTEAQTQATRTMTTTRATPQPKGTTNESEDPMSSPNTGNYIGTALLVFGIVGLLILTAITCRLHITSCMQKKTAVPKKDSCRRPVEESGDGSLCSLKLNP